MIYPVVVVLVAVGILTFIMIKIVPAFEKIFKDFKQELPDVTKLLIGISHAAFDYWWAIPAIPVAIWLFVKLLRKFKYGREGWDTFAIKVPIFGQLIEKNILARTTRTLGTLVSSGVPILEALNITRETSGNAVFERIYGKVSESIREGESISKPLKEFSRTRFNAIAARVLVHVRRWTDRAVDVPLTYDGPLRRRPGCEHGGRRRGDGRARHDAIQGRRHVRRRSGCAYRQFDEADGAAADYLLGRRGGFHRHRAVHAACVADQQSQRRRWWR